MSGICVANLYRTGGVGVVLESPYPSQGSSGILEGHNNDTLDALPVPNPVEFRRKSKVFPNRGLRVADQIHRELAQLITYELRDPRIKWVTIQSVEVSVDYAYAKIYITTLLNPAKKVVSALNHASGYLHRLIYKRLSIHTIPNLKFFYDDSAIHAAKIEALIEKVNSPSPVTLLNAENKEV